MRLLVSIRDIDEAHLVLKAKCDIIDIKNPEEGSLGASHPNLVREIVEIIDGRREISGTIGDLPYLPGTAALAALGMATTKVNYIKAGLYGVRTINEAVNIMKWIVEAVKNESNDVKVIACAYADYQQINSISPFTLPMIGYKSGCEGVLIDIKNKSGSSVFDFIEAKELRRIVKECHNYNLTIALAGGLGINDVETLIQLDVDIMGVRRSVCNNYEWLKARIDPSKVIRLYEEIKKYL
jgi:hypothetical protein